ncbi:1-(5-phosphoribosyl)-5-[(5-phosphoribosylamino)methylideneamino] imidazole-4-carboxamide isomerase [uncultured Eudoraea sp.]|uniref:1-(5-phosphoribosyl)-5-[(5- phosphoribosylamino)methylideneamino]imidazole-4- carboxamide isomerase n=1 Tax=uncultured Eudoraea sp. TaxID=1035614 RepID=UPI002615E6D2|nr:1-(5-phosphoribosyl)-5-[(5-phosphoribosylamino)methylideneamino] imidazole-4-carboxamide isomerase [uncultured Eudoraea sp.]
MRVIPAIDIIGGKCVRLSQGDYKTKKVYNEHPLEVALEFEAHGVQHIHLVDLDGAKAKHIVNYKVLEAIATKTNLKIDFGGGLKSNEDLKIAFDCGAGQITGGSIAVNDRDTFLGWLETYGAKRIILGADVKDERIAISGWQQESDKKLIPFVKDYQGKGIKYVICTDINKDGMLGGPALELYKRLLAQTMINKTAVSMSGIEDVKLPGISLIASGGIGNIADLPALKEIGCEGAILGKAIYENKISLKQLEQFILSV